MRVRSKENSVVTIGSKGAVRKDKSAPKYKKFLGRMINDNC